MDNHQVILYQRKALEMVKNIIYNLTVTLTLHWIKAVSCIKHVHGITFTKGRTVIPGLSTFDYNWLERDAGFAGSTGCDNCLGKELGSSERVSQTVNSAAQI